MRFALAQLVTLAAAGCALSHGRPPDEGSTPSRFPDASFSPDAGVLPRGSPDGARPPTPAVRCAAQDVQQVACPDVDCDEAPSFYWNGDECVAIECGACEGVECGLGWPTREACESAHDACDAPLCRRTGGSWLFWAESCGHYACGLPPPADCLVGSAACDCGLFARFVPDVGCVHDPDCPIPEPVTREQLCTGTGGTWGAYCCDSVCGMRCTDDCVALACDCGPLRELVEGRGCLETERCHSPRLGESCEERSRCAAGTICCERVSGTEDPGEPRCAVPVCDRRPDYDECGNYLLAP